MKKKYSIRFILVLRIWELCNEGNLEGIEAIGTLPCRVFVICLINEGRLASRADFKGYFL
jgi:hypothetical protein